jgi:hypothetical protein
METKLKPSRTWNLPFQNESHEMIPSRTEPAESAVTQLLLWQTTVSVMIFTFKAKKHDRDLNNDHRE